MGTEVYTLGGLIERLKQEKQQLEESGEEEPYVFIGSHHGDLSFEMVDGARELASFRYAESAFDTEKGLLDMSISMGLLGALVIGPTSVSEEASDAAITAEQVREAHSDAGDSDGQ